MKKSKNSKKFDLNFASLCFALKQKLLNRSEAKNLRRKKRKKVEKSEKKRKKQKKAKKGKKSEKSKKKRKNRLEFRLTLKRKLLK